MHLNSATVLPQLVSENELSIFREREILLGVHQLTIISHEREREIEEREKTQREKAERGERGKREREERRERESGEILVVCTILGLYHNYYFS